VGREHAITVGVNPVVRQLSVWSALILISTACGGGSRPGSNDTGGNPPPDSAADVDATGDSTDPTSCVHANDGTCDEPVNCPYGADEADCVAECAAGTRLPFIAGACAFRKPPTQPPPVGSGTGGTLHWTGHRDGTIEVASGEEPATTVDRHYRVYVPRIYNPARPIPLVVMLPGHRVSHYSLAGYTQLTRSAELNGFIVVYAEQEWRWKSFRWAWWTDWNWQAQSNENPDVIFLRKLVEKLGGDYNVDPRRVFAVGHSRGGAMAIIAALELSDIFAGICSQSGFTEFGYHNRIEKWTGRKVPMVFVHGTLDDDVCIDCTSGGKCGVQPGKGCGGVEASDSLTQQLKTLGWGDNDLIYYRLGNVAHRWQSQLNQQVWRFLSARPMPEVQP
jgi:poly(3-hydroxybutyrate) depolymerase